MNSNIESLYKIAQKPTRTIIGLMSGTSLDGLDVALCEVSDSGKNTKATLKEFINSVDNTPKLREFYNTKINEIKNTLLTLNKNITNKAIQIKVNEVVNILPNLGKTDKVNDDHLINLLQHYQLVEELELVK